VLFFDVPKVEIEITHRGSAGIAHGFDILDDCGTGKGQATQLSLTKKMQMLYEPKYALARASYKKGMPLGGVTQQNGNGHTFSMDPE
jgi:hypothetical protein